MDRAVQEKSFRFAVRIVKLCKFLQAEQKEQTMTKQLLRCGTSIGANVTEAQQAQSKKDFISKMSIALKEACETEYWLKLMYETDYLNQKAYQSIISDCHEMQKLLVTIVKTARE